MSPIFRRKYSVTRDNDSEMNQTKEGRKYLENCWRISQTEPDRKAIREKFKRRGGE